MGEIDYELYIKKFTKTSKILSLIAIVICIGVLIGWLFNIQILRTLSPGIVNMNPFSALVFILFSIAIILYNTSKRENTFVKYFIQFTIFLMLVVGSVTALNYMFNLGLTYDTVFLGAKIRESGEVATSRIVPSLSFGFFMFSLSFMFIYYKINYKLSNIFANPNYGKKDILKAQRIVIGDQPAAAG